MSLSKCFFKSLEDIHEPIELFHGEESVFGRGPETKIKDSRCSRKQVKIVVDCKKNEAKITQIGRNTCGLNGMALAKGRTVTAKDGDRIEMLLGQFVHVIEFEPPADGDADRRVASLESPPDEEEEQMGNGSGEESEGEENDGDDGDDDDEEEEEEEEESGEPGAKKARSGTEEVTSEAWESVDDGKLLIYTHPEVKPSSSIASYDLDGTVIGTKSGSVFPKNKDDWKILYPQVTDKLKEMHGKGHKIVFFTNQAGLSSGKTGERQFKSKIEDVVKAVAVPVQVFIATGHSYYRKPAIGMWDAAGERNGGLEIDSSKSFYCGDAAGREAGPGQKKKDFSCSDLLFAKNLGLRFETPEHHFLNREMPALKVSVFDPNAIPCDIPLCTPSWGQIIANRSELIVLVGCPGSGKSHFVKTHLVPAGYVHVNRDSLGSWNRCVQVMEAALRSKQKVVVDNTNPDVESRKRYIKVAKNYTHFVRCFIMNTSFQHAKHNNKFRQITDPSHAIVTDVVMHTYNSKYKEPTTEEGFTEIIKINFWPTFKDPNLEKVYKLYLLEK